MGYAKIVKYNITEKHQFSNQKTLYVAHFNKLANYSFSGMCFLQKSVAIFTILSLKPLKEIKIKW